MSDFYPLNEYAADLTRFSIEKNLYALFTQKKSDGLDYEIT